ncbi:MAG TPA: DUF4260 domain-containing protein [Polyangiaceae bacterium]|jgi:hypothetical protein|nr:DUF4260 domain-containing protein [Polyangiaceae bacterium]
MANNDSYQAHVSGTVRALLRIEGLAVFLLALLLYARTGASWGLFGALILVPDLSLLAYLIGPRAGAAAYNTMHSYLGPLFVVALGLALAPGLLPVAFIWGAHVGIDRAMGYGLKYASAFRDTHLGRIGRAVG